MKTTKIKYPLVLCRADPVTFRGAKKQTETVSFWCPFCRKRHTHGAQCVPGHRVAHCLDPTSPFYEHGYMIELEGDQGERDVRKRKLVLDGEALI